MTDYNDKKTFDTAMNAVAEKILLAFGEGMMEHPNAPAEIGLAAAAVFGAGMTKALLEQPEASDDTLEGMMFHHEDCARRLKAVLKKRKRGRN